FGTQRMSSLSLSFLGWRTLETATSLILALPTLTPLPVLLSGTLTRAKSPHRSREMGVTGTGIVKGPPPREKPPTVMSPIRRGRQPGIPGTCADPNVQAAHAVGDPVTVAARIAVGADHLPT